MLSNVLGKLKGGKESGRGRVCVGGRDWLIYKADK